ncbi:hypothetical protein ACPPVO_22705 [Dactylosporangium sp. McL0621]|uniref:hypothetical protein n=1 Tax=Dactylosporangium sp. McL0621 TaxID=3415678 RepID=UPI003CFBAB55
MGFANRSTARRTARAALPCPANRDVDRIQRFSRGVDFDQILEADRILLWWLIAAVRRAGVDPRKDLDLYEVEVWDKHDNRVVRVSAASPLEVTDDMVPR